MAQARVALADQWLPLQLSVAQVIFASPVTARAIEVIAVTIADTIVTRYSTSSTSSATAVAGWVPESMVWEHCLFSDF